MDLKGQRVRGPVPQEIEVGPAQIIGELEDIFLHARPGEGEIGILDDVLPVVPAVNIGVQALLAGKIIVARPAIERVGIEHAIDGVVTGRLGIGEHALDDLAEVEAGAVVEDQSLDQVGRDIVETGIAAHEIAEDAEV